MVDSVPKGSFNSSLLKSPTAIPETWDAFRAMLVSSGLPVDILFNAEGWQIIGHLLNKANLLTDATAAKARLSGVNATVNNAIMQALSLSIGTKSRWFFTTSGTFVVPRMTRLKITAVNNGAWGGSGCAIDIRDYSAGDNIICTISPTATQLQCTIRGLNMGANAATTISGASASGGNTANYTGGDGGANGTSATPSGGYGHDSPGCAGGGGDGFSWDQAGPNSNGGDGGAGGVGGFSCGSGGYGGRGYANSTVGSRHGGRGGPGGSNLTVALFGGNGGNGGNCSGTNGRGGDGGAGGSALLIGGRGGNGVAGTSYPGSGGIGGHAASAFAYSASLEWFGIGGDGGNGSSTPNGTSNGGPGGNGAVGGRGGDAPYRAGQASADLGTGGTGGNGDWGYGSPGVKATGTDTGTGGAGGIGPTILRPPKANYGGGNGGLPLILIEEVSG